MKRTEGEEEAGNELAPASFTLTQRLVATRRNVVRISMAVLCIPFAGLAWIGVAGFAGVRLWSPSMLPGFALFLVGVVVAEVVLHRMLYRAMWVCPGCQTQLPRDAYPMNGRRAVRRKNLKRRVVCTSCKTDFGMF